MKNILLINPGHDDEHEIYKHKSHRRVHRDPPPVSLLYVGTFLKENGFEVDIIDTHIAERYKELIKNKLEQNDYLFVGITTIIGKFLKNAEELTKFIREINPEFPIVWGGIMASINPDACLKKYKPDFIVRYEGEETCFELAKALKNKEPIENVKGISYLKNDEVLHTPARIPKINLDEYPLPKWELFGDYFNKNQTPYYFLIMSSRGCPFNCKFCYKHSIDEEVREKVKPWRYRSAHHTIKEIEYIHDKTGTKVFTSGDDNFFVNKQRALDILAYFKKKEFYIEEIIGHLNCIDDELIEAMGGVVQTFIFSIETASPRLQNHINKQLRLEDIPIKSKKLYNKGIVASMSFIIGFPTETDEDLQMNIDMMKKVKQNNPFARGNSYFFLPLPKTQLYTEVEKMYNLKLPHKLEDLKEANFWVKDTNDPIGKKFRPWLSDEKFEFLVYYGTIFNNVFRNNNTKTDYKVKEMLKNNPKLKQMFGDIETIEHPKTDYIPYVLDRVLKDYKIDLLNDLKNK